MTVRVPSYTPRRRPRSNPLFPKQSRMAGSIEVMSRWILLGFIIPRGDRWLTYDSDQMPLGDFSSFAEDSRSFDGIVP